MSTKRYCTYSKQNLRHALDAVKEGVPFATAAKDFNVPRTTLIGKIKGIYPEDCRSGASTILTSDEEDLLEQWLVNMGAKGFPVTKDQLLDSVALLVKQLKRPNKFADGRPGRHWFEGFLRRHPRISRRLSQNLTSSRASITAEKIKTWFQEIQDYFSLSNIDIKDPKRIFNTDESAFYLSPKGSSVLVKKGSKLVHDRSGDDKECLTVLITGNAVGMLAPTMIMYPYERIPKVIISKVPSKWGIGKSPSGWMTAESFYEYITNIFYPYLVSENIDFPVILYLDGHKSHVTLPLTEFCVQKKIILISLLPNSTHMLQPLDVGLFRTLKLSWKRQVQKYKIQHGYKSLNRENFASVLYEAINSVTNIGTIFQNAFRTCGLFPFDCSQINFSKLVEEKDNPNKIMEAEKKNPEILNHLKFIESYLNIETLQKFKELRGSDWTGPTEDKNLYCTWLKIFKDSGLRYEQQCAEELTAVSDVIIEVEDGLVLENGWENLVVVETSSPKSKAEEMLTVEDSNTQNFETPVKQRDNERTPESTPVNNNNSSEISLNQYENLTTSPENKENQHHNEASEENTRTELRENDSCSNILPGVSIPTPFKESLFWPEPVVNKKAKVKRQIKLPSVGTSDAWRDYHIKKEERLKTMEEEKADRKRKREENKILRLNKQKKVRKAAPKKTNVIQEDPEEQVNNERSAETDGRSSDREKNNVYNIGDFVVVNFENELYPGEITDIRDKTVLVNAMAKAVGESWKWPKPKDEIEYEYNEIVQKIKTPREMNKRGLYVIEELKQNEDDLQDSDDDV